MNIAIVGCGRISKRHIEALDATTNAYLTAVCDIQPERMSAGLLEDRDLIRVTDKGIDAVAVYTPRGYTRCMPQKSPSRPIFPQLLRKSRFPLPYGKQWRSSNGLMRRESVLFRSIRTATTRWSSLYAS